MNNQDESIAKLNKEKKHQEEVRFFFIFLTKRVSTIEYTHPATKILQSWNISNEVYLCR